MSPNKQTNNWKPPFFFKLLLEGYTVRIMVQATKKNNAKKMMYDKPEHVTSRLRKWFAGGMWKTLELWARYTLRYCNLGLVGYCDRSVASRKAERNAHSCSWFRWGMRTLSGTGLGSVLGYFGQEHGFILPMTWEFKQNRIQRRRTKLLGRGSFPTEENPRRGRALWDHMSPGPQWKRAKVYAER